MHRWIVYGACAASFALALFFIFVWAPHPWGWAGFDHYDDLGHALARGETFPTLDQPWGYGWYLAAFYRAFGDRLWIPLVVQALLNAALPLLIYEFARTEFGQQIATVAAVLTGLFSFNTVYASTQSADALCTVLFTTAMVMFTRGRRADDWRFFALAGVLLGTSTQFRPNLVLMPFVLALFLICARRIPRRVGHAAVLLAGAGLVMMPWIIYSARLTGEFLPTSTHGGQQLWYGTLQTGPYLKSRAYNPRRVFETGSFPYTSIDDAPLVVTTRVAPCAGTAPLSLALVYWTDRDPRPTRIEASSHESHAFQVMLAPAPAPTTYYFFFEVIVPGEAVKRVPAAGKDAPYVYFVSSDHLGDLDRHGDLVDVFDVVRLLRYVAWHESIAAPERLDFDGDGRLSSADIAAAVDILLVAAGYPHQSQAPDIASDATQVSLRLADGSTCSVARAWSGRITDLDIRGDMAAALLHSTLPFAALRAKRTEPDECPEVTDVAVNSVFYRAQPQAMRRYLALAFDNIRREPTAYLAAVAYRTIRVFLIEGSDDPQTAQQFAESGRVYRVARAASVCLFVLFLIGAWTAWRRGCAIALPLVVIACFPATLAFVLTNMRYSMTVQPLLFVFVAAALVGPLEAFNQWWRGSQAGRN